MARNLDDPPIYDPLIKQGSLLLSDTFADWFATTFQTISEYLTQTGIFLPTLTTAQRDELITHPGEGQMIFNTTLKKGQIYQNGAWVNFS